MSRLPILFVAALCALLAAPAGATTLVPLDPVQLAYFADLIVEAEVEDVRAEREPGNVWIQSIVTLRLTRVLKGEAIEGDRVLLREWGGVLGDERTEMASSPVFVAGERVLVHLERAEDAPGLWRTLGMSQGKRTLIREADTGRDVVLPLHLEPSAASFDEASVPLPAFREYGDQVTEAIQRLVDERVVPPYTRVPGLPQGKDDRFRADAQAEGQSVDPRADSLRSTVREATNGEGR